MSSSVLEDMPDYGVVVWKENAMKDITYGLKVSTYIGFFELIKFAVFKLKLY